MRAEDTVLNSLHVPCNTERAVRWTQALLVSSTHSASELAEPHTNSDHFLDRQEAAQVAATSAIQLAQVMAGFAADIQLAAKNVISRKY